MSEVQNSVKIDLNDIVNISEDEFKKQISAWIDERGISRKLQSKLRADLFEQFNRTHLGRQMSEQHSLVHRIVLSPLILVLNTLVADFLHAEDCHFTLSVFANEVPYKNTLPNFEATPPRTLFRFTDNELNDIFEAIGISKQDEQRIREFYLMHGDDSEIINRSLLYCIVRTIISPAEPKIVPEKTYKMKPRQSSTPVPSSTQVSFSTSDSSPRKSRKYEEFHVSSRYFKCLNRYLDILSDRLSEMSKTMHEKHSKRTSNESVSQESSLRKDLRKMIENINRLTKSKQKSKRFQDILNSIERLSSSVDKCSGNMENLLMAAKTNVPEKNTNAQKDRLSDMDYATWLKELKTSEHGKKFIDRLESSLQKTMEKERENLEKLYDEKTNNYRMLIRLHYKQKYDTIKKANRAEATEISSIDKFSLDDTDKALADSLANRAIENEQHVEQIVQSAKTRLQQLERESEQLDESFQAYLRRQQMRKEQMNTDVTQIWESYNLSKAALEQFDSIVGQTNLMSNCSKFINTTNIDYALNDELNDTDELLLDLQELRELKSPEFDKNEVFSTEKVFAKKPRSNEFDFTSFVDKSPPKQLDKVKKPESFHNEFHNFPDSTMQFNAVTDLPLASTPMKHDRKPILEIPPRKTANGIDDYLNKNVGHVNEVSFKRAVASDTMEVSGDQMKFESDSHKKTQEAKLNEMKPKEVKPKEPTKKPEEAQEKNQTINGFSKQNGFAITEKIIEAVVPKTIPIEPVASTSKLSTENLNENVEKSTPIFTRLSSIESGDDTSDRISIGPAQISKEDDFWI